MWQVFDSLTTRLETFDSEGFKYVSVYFEIVIQILCYPV